MKQVRRCVFETNSSSTHSITFCTEKEFEDFKNGKLLWDIDDEELVPAVPQNNGCFTYQQWRNDEDLESFEKRYTSSSGDKIVAFGLYGFSG